MPVRSRLPGLSPIPPVWYIGSMASALPLLLLAGAAMILMGRSGDDDDGDGNGDGNGDDGLPFSRGSSNPDAAVMTVPWLDLSLHATGDPEGSPGSYSEDPPKGTFGPGQEVMPVEWPVATAGDELRFSGAPLTKTVGGDPTHEKHYSIGRSSDAEPWLPDLDETVALVRDAAKGEIVLRSKTGVLPGPFFLKHYTFGTVESGPNAGKSFQVVRRVYIAG